eukprot:12881591-Alexandrium_andersonii.AAC.1
MAAGSEGLGALLGSAEALSVRDHGRATGFFGQRAKGRVFVVRERRGKARGGCLLYTSPSPRD